MSGPVKLELFYDFSSPFTYLATTQVEALAERTGARLIWRPMLLGGVFKALGGPTMPMQTFSEPKRRHSLLELHRWAEHWDVPFVFPSIFPMKTLLPLRVVLQLDGPEAVAAIHAVFRAYWADDQDISDPEVVGGILERLDLPAAALLEGTADPAVKRRLIDATEKAVARGVFGAPTFFVDDDLLFWGQDRFEHLEKALGGWRPRSG